MPDDEIYQIYISDKKENTEVKTIKWSEILGNPYRYGLNPLMLSQPVYQREAAVCIRGGEKRRDNRVPVVIQFDEDYVISYLIKTIYEKLQPQNYNEFQKLLAKTWKRYKESQLNG